MVSFNFVAPLTVICLSMLAERLLSSRPRRLGFAGVSDADCGADGVYGASRFVR